MGPRRHKTGNYWALCWGITLGLIFLGAATISFTLDDRGTTATSFSYATR